MKLSIITVNLNNRDGLKKTIDSIVAQTFKDFEWIVIDGGSTDGSKELLEEYSEHFAYWVSEPDKGVYNAMNKGIAVAKGEYLQFLNSGDWLVDNTVLESVSTQLDSDIVYGDVELRMPDGTVKNFNYPNSISMRFFYFSNICHQTTFIKRALFDSKSYNEDLKIVSDWEFFVQAMFDNRSFKHLPIIICNFGMDGVSSTNTEIMYQEKNSLLKLYYPRAFDEDIRMVSDVESHLGHLSITDFNQLCEKHRVIAKIFTLITLFMKKK